MIITKRDGKIVFPEDQFLIIDHIAYDTETERMITKIIVKFNKCTSYYSDSYTWLTLYGIEERSGYLSSLVTGKVRGHEFSLYDTTYTHFRLMRSSDVPLLVNWYWLSNTVKKKYFGM